VQVVILDLSSLLSVRAATADISRTNSVIDVQINNAGVMAIPTQTLSVDGVELQLATNFLGHFVLTQSLLPLLKAVVGGARVVNITSAGYVLTPFRFSDYNFDGEKALPVDEQVYVDTASQMGFAGTDPNVGYHPFITYAHSNVANMLFTKRLAEKYASEGITSVCAEPGGMFFRLAAADSYRP
jgi:NAD(P)-dependent dehydrogenase (short-subunit alcohol dehydrogenase family)